MVVRTLSPMLYSIDIEDGGDGAITVPQSCLSGGIPFICRGEGEAAIPNVT